MRGDKSALMCTKTLLIAFNLFFVLIGLVSIGVSCWTLVSPNDIFGISNIRMIHIIAWCLLIFGGILVFLAFLGCTGAALENRCLLIMFFTLLCGIFMGCLVAGVLIAVFKDELGTLAVNRLNVAVQQEYGVSEVWTEWIDFLQTKLKCCAVDDHGAALYVRSAWYFQQQQEQQQQQQHEEQQRRDQRNQQPHLFLLDRGLPSELSWGDAEQRSKRVDNVPASCCLRDGDSTDFVNLTACQTGQLDSSANPFLNPSGCAPALAVALRSQAVPILVTLTGLIVILVSGLILSLILLRGTVPDDNYDPVVQSERALRT